MSSIQYQYLRGLTTISNIIKETCETIWIYLNSLVLSPRLKKEEWLSIANNFEELWNFNHCIRAIDGKHVVIQCPGNSGSSYYNYKGTHSIVLLAICDANYVFRYVDIGAFGRGSDSAIFKNSTVGRKFNSKQMNLPGPSPLSAEGPDMPYYLVGDEAFPLTDYLLRPYPGKGLTKEREIYNYRLSRARRIIENTFGILASQ
ncbi:protein ALP1-like [Nylanderia fulva]|uniref:protein ALP1-like n=1 Tax=Nylanderia fulva TaxID=613905 RepID=UPI0010FB9E04|nr:protein ALP1-like [Nylanderia fulva]